MFLMEQEDIGCSSKGTGRYVNGTMTCTIHDKVTEEEGNDNGAGILIFKRMGIFCALKEDHLKRRRDYTVKQNIQKLND